MELEEISLDKLLQDAPLRLLVETEAGRTFVERRTQGAETMMVAYLPDGRRTEVKGMSLDQPVRQAVAATSSSRPLRAFAIDKGIIVEKINHVQQFIHFLPLLIGAALTITGFSWTSLGFLRFLIMGLGIAFVVVSLDAHKKSNTYRTWVVQHGAKKELTQAEQFVLPGAAEDIAIDDVKAEYGRLISDIAYRIEYPALFDPHEPTSKAFTLALLQWDNNDGVVGDDERRELALRVRATFEAARANAERIGMQHIPVESREKASTALKAARLATDQSATEAERATALQRAVTILDELALYFLPSGAQARKAITGNAPLQLPGRRA